MIKVEATVNAPIQKVWAFWTSPEHIVNWNNASEDWHTPKAENDLHVGGKFVFTMAARDGSVSFDFNGTYDEVVEHQAIEYTIEDGRKVKITFKSAGDRTEIIETFEAENQNPPELQQAGWQAILDNFKKYTEEND